MIQRLARQWSLMNAMAQVAHVDLSAVCINNDIERRTLREAVFRCARCAHVRECKAFLSGEAAKEGQIPGFCLNKAMLERLQALN